MIYLRLLLLCLCCWLLMLSSGLGASEKQLVIAIGRDFFDGPDSRAYLHGSTGTWEGLTYLDDKLSPLPVLAESWEAQKGGKVWVFKLRKHVLFHDGTPVTSKDVATSMWRIKSNPKYDPSGVYQYLISFETPDDHTIIFHLQEPNPAFPAFVAYYSSPVLKPSTFNKEGRLDTLIATGPYRLEQVRKGQFVEVRAFKDYWGEQPKYGKVIFRIISDAKARVTALLTGEVDVIADVGAILPSQVDLLKNSSDVVLKSKEVATTHYVLFNCSKEPFKESGYRLWLTSIINRRELVEHVVEVGGKVAETLFTPLASMWSRENTFSPDFSKGKVLKTSEKLTLVVSRGVIQRWPYLEIAQVILETLASRDLKVDLRILEPGAYVQGLKDGNFDMVLTPFTLMTGDPDFFYSSLTGGYLNFNCIGDEVKDLIKQARVEMNVEKRKSLYASIAGWFSEKVPVLPLYHDVSFYAYRRSLGEFEMDGLFKPRLQETK